jgi:hypothetical protein
VISRLLSDDAAKAQVSDVGEVSAPTGPEGAALP